MIVVAKICVIEGRFFSSVINILAIKFQRSFENVDARGVYYPLEILIPSIYKEVPSNGGFNAQSSYRRTPSDQMSDLKL